jgi:3-deoxy-D-manno-octulosonic-acid transferase
MIGALYRVLTDLAGPALRLVLARRRARGKEDPARLGERYGLPGVARPQGPLIWLHGASVGEAVSALPLIRRLLDEDEHRHVLVTTGTVTSARLLAERLPARAFHQFAPLDRAAWVRRFLDHWRPDLALWMESELWPNLVGETRRRGIPMVLINGRMSLRSFAGWRWAPDLARRLLGGMALVLAQSEEDRARLERLGARQARNAGNLKFAAAPLPADAVELRRLHQAIGARPVWVAASTHPGEEAQIAAAHRMLKARHPGVLTILVPRHAARGAQLAPELAGLGFKVARRSAHEPIKPDTDIYLADTMGELGLFYRLAPIAFVGGSLVRHGGQNPLEPAQLDCAVLHGPHVTNFARIAETLDEAGASEIVGDSAGLAEAVARLFDDAALRERRAQSARQVSASQRDVLERYMDALRPHLDRLAETDGAARSAVAAKKRARA